MDTPARRVGIRPEGKNGEAGRTGCAVAVLNGFALTYAGRPVPIRKRKAQALLGYLLLTSSLQDTREKITGLLWSEVPEEKARTSLRQTLHQLRDVFHRIGFDGFAFSRESVALHRSKLDVDVWTVTDCALRHEVHPLLLDARRLPDQLLAGFDDVDPAFRVWLLVQREAWQQRLVRHLNASLAAAEADLGASESVAAALLNLDPTHEPACQRLMQVRAERGDAAGALKVYKALWDVLGEEYDTEPSDDTQRLVARVKNGEIHFHRPAKPLASAAPASPGPTRPEPLDDAGASQEGVPPNQQNLIIVSGFESQGVKPEHSYLIDALRHGIISRLVRFREWSVMDGKALADRPKPAAPGVRVFSVEATVFPAGESHMFTVTLKDAEHGRFIWSDSFVLDVARWFAIQQSLIRRLAMALKVHVSVERLASVARTPDVSLSVFDRSLRGHGLVLEWDRMAWKRAHEIFSSVVQEAPHFAPGYVGLVRLLNTEHLVFSGITRTKEKLAQSLETATMAVQADPFDSNAQHCFAWSSALSGRFDNAELGFGLALDLNENDPWVLISSALGFAYCGHHARAMDLADQAYRIDPSPSPSHRGYQAQTRLVCGDYEGSADAAGKAPEALPFLGAWHAAALAHCQRLPEAVDRGRSFLARARQTWHGPGTPTDEELSAWLLRSFPFRRQVDWERLRSGMQGACIPVPLSLPS